MAGRAGAAAAVAMPCWALAQQGPGAAGEEKPPAQATTADAPNIAWFYGDKPPVAQLRAFDAVVVEPDHGFDPSRAKTPRHSGSPT